MKQWASPVLVLVLTTSLVFLGADARAQSSSEHHPASVAAGTIHNLQNEHAESNWEGSKQGITYSEFSHRFVGLFVLLFGLVELGHALRYRSPVWPRPVRSA